MDFDGILNTPYNVDIKPADLASYSTAHDNNLAINSQYNNTASADILSDFVNTQLKYNDIWGAALGQSLVQAANVQHGTPNRQTDLNTRTSTSAQGKVVKRKYKKKGARKEMNEPQCMTSEYVEEITHSRYGNNSIQAFAAKNLSVLDLCHSHTKRSIGLQSPTNSSFGMILTIRL